jgi:hypothetical protein
VRGHLDGDVHAVAALHGVAVAQAASSSLRRDERAAAGAFSRGLVCSSKFLYNRRHATLGSDGGRRVEHVRFGGGLWVHVRARETSRCLHVVLAATVALHCASTQAPERPPVAKSRSEPTARTVDPVEPTEEQEQEQEQETAELPDGAAEDEPPSDPLFREAERVLTDCSSWERPGGRVPLVPVTHCAYGPMEPRAQGTYEHDQKAIRRLEEALFRPRLSVDLDQMLRDVLAASEHCEDRCSRAMQAKIWMYAGLVLGSGRRDLKGAQCAFEVAFQWEPDVAVERDLASEEVSGVFARTRRRFCKR